jgi:Ca2+-binding EF-hand superfamily protein
MILLEMAPHQQIEYISKNTHFSTAEVRDLQKMFRNLTQMYGTPGDMNRALFRVFFIQVLGITDSVMLDQIFNYFDAGGEGSISVTEFLSNLSIIIRGTLEEHIKFCYAVYDLNGDGGIGRPEVMALIHDTLSAPLDEDDDVDDSIRDMANMIMTQLDPEGTGQVTIHNFREAVLKDPLALQILGPCLPEEKRVRSLMSLVIWDYQDFATNYSLPCCPGYPAERMRYDNKADMYNSEAIKAASVTFMKPIKAKGR